MKKRGKFKMILAVSLTLVVMGLGGTLVITSGERKEGRSLPIAAINFRNLNDGMYIGEYEGGKWKLRANKVQVTVSSGKVTDIRILQHKENQKPEFTGKLYGRVMAAQSLQVDTISGATITSKAYLKSVENALAKAEKS